MAKDDTKILVVDDDALTRDMLVFILESSGYQIEAADDGTSAIRKFQSDPEINLIVSDVVMPGMSGMDLLKEVRKEDKNKPFIILTGTSDVQYAIEALKYGASDYILKDENIEDTILVSVDKVLERLRLQNENRQLLDDLARKNKELTRFNEVQGSSLPTFVINEQHIITHWNKACETLTGLSAAEMIGTRNHSQALARDERPVMADLIVDNQLVEEIDRYYAGEYQKSIIVEGALEFEAFYPELGSKGKWLLSTTAPLRNGKGQIKGTIETLQDITARKRAENALRESEEKYRSVMEASPDPIVVYDTKGRATYLNPAFTRFFGWTPEELLGNKVDFVPESERLKTKTAIGTIIREGFYQGFETRRYTKQRDIIDVSITAANYLDQTDNSIGMVVNLHDITARKRAEVALRESEEKYRSVMEATPDPIVVYDLEGKVSYLNPAFTRVFGWTLEELICKIIDFVPEEENAITQQILEKTKKDGHCFGFETRRSTKDGSIIDVRINASNYFDSEGNSLGIVAYLQDITERKRFLDEKTKLEEQLRRTQKMEAIGTLAGGIAHDFNNILTAIFGYIQIAMMKTGDDSPILGDLSQVQNAANRARDLVQQILAFSRQSEQELKPIQANLIVKEAIKLLRASLPTTIEIQQDITSDSLVLGDPTQIHQIMMNLCTNAGHAMQAEGGMLSIGMKNIEFDETSATAQRGLNPGLYLSLTVSDTGQGMVPEVLERIFDPFFTTKKKSEGTGLGLSVVHGIVKSHGGAISAYSEPGKGTSFKVYLPAIERSKPKSKEKAQAPIPRGTESILFVDDEKPLADIGKQLLESLGYQTTIRTNSNEALELFKAQPDRFDLVITDVTMPNMTGDELAKKLTAIHPEIPIILCTGFSNKLIKSAGNTYIRAIIMKPFVIRELAETVRKALEGTSKR